MTLKHPLAALLACVLVSAGCHKIEPLRGTFIETPGIWELGRGAALEIFPDGDGLLNVRHTRSNGNTAEWEKGILREEADWFAYVADFDEIWLATGDDLLLLFEGPDASGSTSALEGPGTRVTTGAGSVEIPEVVIQRLDPELRDRLGKPHSPEPAAASSPAPTTES